jgi:hypothetical protein
MCAVITSNLHLSLPMTVKLTVVPKRNRAIPRSFDGLGTRALTKVENRRKSKRSIYLAFIYLLYCYHKKNY